jgi:RNA polymerase sigma-70 factor (ECF subfamily)
MNEKKLVERARGGDFEAFQALVDAHKQKVYGLAVRLTGNTEDAEDVFQEALLRAIDKIDQFRGDASFGTWLYQIALNQARALHAREKRADLKPIEDYLPGSAAHGPGGEEHRLFDWKDPHRMLESRELEEIIGSVIDELPFPYREAFVLRYIEELPVKEVARITEQSLAATKSRILRARLALRQRLSEIFEERYGEELPGLHSRAQ